MTPATETILQTLSMLRARLAEVDRSIARLERVPICRHLPERRGPDRELEVEAE